MDTSCRSQRMFAKLPWHKRMAAYMQMLTVLAFYLAYEAVRFFDSEED